MTPAQQAATIDPRAVASPWPGHEYIRGFGVFAMPTSTGDVLCLRVFPESSFAPYTTVWHRDPRGHWAMFVDAPSPDIACPRYYGPGFREILPASVDVQWSDADRLEVQVTPAARPASGDGYAPAADDRPQLRWSLALSEPAWLKCLNRWSSALPRWTWKPDALLRPRKWTSRRLLGMGDVSLRATTPSGHLSTLCPQRICFISNATAILDGRDLGQPSQHADNPTVGDVRFPARPTFAFGEAYFRGFAAR